MRTLTVLALLLPAPFAARSALAEQAPLPPPPIVIFAAREDLWAALTTPEGIAATVGGRATVDLRPGGVIRRHADPNAPSDAEGWASTTVLAFVPPRLLVLGGDTPSAWTAIDLDALDPLRTRVRIEHVGRPESAEAAAAIEERDRALVASLRARFPRRPDPVVAALTPLAGAWEERSGDVPDVVARWTVAVHAGDERTHAESPSVSLERRSGEGEVVDRWVFWREAASGRWRGGLLTGTRATAWEIRLDGGGRIAWSNAWDESGGRTISVEGPPRDGVVTVETIEGCFGAESRWTRVADAK